MLVEREKSPNALQKKATRGAKVSDKRNGWLDAARPNSWNVNISFYRPLCVAEVCLPYVVETAEDRKSRRNSW